jgi:hypothetical protein
MADPVAGVRVTAAQVMEIISTSQSTAVVNAFINSAHAVVEANLAGDLDETLLEQIELWMAAHFLATKDQRKSAVKVGDLSVTYQGQTGMGLKATLYGQQAMSMDTTGKLASLDTKRAVISME